MTTPDVVFTPDVATATFRRRPRKVHAVRLNRANAIAVARWCNGFVVHRTVPWHLVENLPDDAPQEDLVEVTVSFYDRDGVSRARQQDWIVRDGEEFFVVLAEHFDGQFYAG